ncbi:PilZ domain-containing protein [Candidatus Omnitrophota bacterium]
MNIGVDNRLFERTEGELGVRYSPQGSDREFCTTSKNISGGGIRMTLLKRLKVGDILDLEIFKYNRDVKARCRGRIAWMWEEPMDKESETLFEAGIQFIDRKLMYLGRLISYLESDVNNSILS